MLDIGRKLFSSSTSSNPPPYATFVGPDSNKTIYLVDFQGHSTPLFTTKTSSFSKRHLEISRIRPDGAQYLFCTATFSSWTGSITLSLNGQEIKLKDPDGLTSSRILYTPNGELKWKYSKGGSAVELWDQRKVKLARYEFKSSSTGGQPKLEIFVQGDDAFIDLILMSGVAVLVQKKKEMSEAKIAGEVASAVAGA